MGNVINLDLIAEPMNWVIVFLILLGAALATRYVSASLQDVGIQLL